MDEDEVQDGLLMVHDVAFAVAEGLGTFQARDAPPDAEPDVRYTEYIAMRLEGAFNDGSSEPVSLITILTPTIVTDIVVSLAAMGASAYGAKFHEYLLDLIEISNRVVPTMRPADPQT